jgi:hypothetical protein
MNELYIAMNSDTEPDISDSEESEILVCSENRPTEPEPIIRTYTFYNDPNTGFQIAGPSVPTYTFTMM